MKAISKKLPLQRSTPSSRKNKPEPEAVEKEALRSLEEWEALLLDPNNEASTQELLEAYATDKLGEKTWAFMLAEKMMEDPRPEIQLRALTILNSLPSDRSFTILARARDEERSEQVQKDIVRSLSRYSQQLESLPILERSVMNEDPRVQLEAARQIDASAKAHLVENGGRTRGAPRAQKVNKDRYKSSVEIILAASRKSTLPEVKLELDQRADNINQLLSNLSIAQADLN